VAHDPHVRPPSSEHSKSAVGSVEVNSNVAVGSGVDASGPETMVVSGTTVAEPAAIANGDRPSTTPHAVPVPASVVSVTSLHRLPSWCRTRTGRS
jgi:hypothetical protein